MQTITIENQTCLYLNHGELIESMYRKHVSADDRQCFTLKSELFNFKPKVIENAESVKQTKNKRKRKAETENEESVVQINTMLQPFLKEIQNLAQRSIGRQTNLEDMPRLWEDKMELPQFRGANATLEFQTTQFHHQSYIIPPKCKFYNYSVEDMPKLLPELEKYDVIIMDMPWQNKYIKRLKKVKQSLAYQMLDNENLKKMPVRHLIHSRSLVVLWCTNALQHQKAIHEEFLPLWDLKLVHTLKWFKINTEGDLISPVKAEGYKQPYELLFIACHKDRSVQDLEGMRKIDLLASIPSIIHSHKPPLTEWLKEFVDDPTEFKGLEIFARYLQPQFTSLGLEVLKLMDKRLYNTNP